MKRMHLIVAAASMATLLTFTGCTTTKTSKNGVSGADNLTNSIGGTDGYSGFYGDGNGTYYTNDNLYSGGTYRSYTYGPGLNTGVDTVTPINEMTYGTATGLTNGTTTGMR